MLRSSAVFRSGDSAMAWPSFQAMGLPGVSILARGLGVTTGCDSDWRDDWGMRLPTGAATDHLRTLTSSGTRTPLRATRYARCCALRVQSAKWLIQAGAWQPRRASSSCAARRKVASSPAGYEVRTDGQAGAVPVEGARSAWRRLAGGVLDGVNGTNCVARSKPARGLPGVGSAAGPAGARRGLG